jgi:hypothetical protein
MPPVGSMSEAGEQMANLNASVATSQAISAKDGEAARPSQPAASRGRQIGALLVVDAQGVVIVVLLIDSQRFQSPLNQART